MKKTEQNADQQTAAIQSAIDLIKANKEFFAECFKREDNAPGDLFGISYIVQWFKILTPAQKKFYQQFVEATTRLLKTSKKSIKRESLETIADAVDPKNPNEGRVLDGGINKILELNNALSETIKGSLGYRNQDPLTQAPEDIRPHDYMWRYQENGRLNKFLDANPKFVNFLVRNEAYINSLGTSYGAWWLQHKRRAAAPLKEDTELEQAISIAGYAQKSKEALKQYKAIHTFFDTFVQEAKAQGYWIDPEQLDETKIDPMGYLCFSAIENHFPEILMTIGIVHEGMVHKLDAIITIDANAYHVDDETMQTYKEVVLYGAIALQEFRDAAKGETAPKQSLS